MRRLRQLMQVKAVPVMRIEKFDTAVLWLDGSLQYRRSR
jgi:hypothetical protein